MSELPSRSRLPSFVGLAKAAAALTIVFSLATFADHLHRYLELFSHFRLQYLFVALILGLLLTILRCRAWAGVMLLLAAVNAVPVSLWYFAEAKAAPNAVTVKVLHANVFTGNDETDRLVDLLRLEKPDIVFLQEVNGRWIDSLAELREQYPYHHEIAREDNFGIAVYTRDAAADIQIVSSPPQDFPTLVVRVTVAGKAVTFVSTHPHPPVGETAYYARNEQLESIGELVQQLDSPKVLIGDLNTSMWSHHYDDLLTATNLRDARYGFGVIPTWPRQLPFAMIPIDHCLVSADIAVVSVRSGPGIGSDHLPLIVELAF